MGYVYDPTLNAYVPAGSQWMIPVFEHYLGRGPYVSEMQQIMSLGFNESQLTQHLRQQPSYIKGVTIGTLEDMYKTSSPAYFKWLGRDVNDGDIRQLINAGIRTPDQIEKWLTNQPSVIAAHPGAPLGLNDVQWGQHKAAIDSDYQQNLGRDANDQEARDAYTQSASPFRKQPAEEVGLSAGVGIKSGGVNAGSLISQSQVAPNSRLGFTG